ncbi:LOW QUALITY PROTEIN: cysteine protease ATG4C [Bufo gargarizans]|uniref:LOW QUALITY PROTEIN: cysteine protease ATG4C n=1 Tax=Bufo gargarizans TaxID=30331 RepID=UPI001CF45CB1|nr:LOW QUALITY PROTEIN: cysteine protease ATG4C [Bufo gargarizans]
MEASGTDEKVKSMFLSAWHNVKYSWVLRTKTYFRRNSPVFLLGKCYHFKFEDSESSPNGSDSGSVTNEDVFGTVEDFRKDFISRIWLTYREEFPLIDGSTWTTDCGWGCTLRTGQMLLAQGLLVHFIGRDWLWPNALDLYRPEADFWLQNSARKLAPIESSYNDLHPYGTASSKLQAAKENEDENQAAFYHRKIISWFSDHPMADFGIHQLIKLGKQSGKVAGDWYGPAVVSHLLRKAMEDSVDPELQGISIYVAQDCTIYRDDVYDQQDNSDCDKSVLILVPVRLGGERTNTEYFAFVKGILSLEYCLGIIGGRPKQSYYFVGFQDDSLIYMDPHYCQSFVDVSIKDFPLESFHCPSPKKMPFKKMDPSCTIGFYCRNAWDFERVVDELTKVLKSSSKLNYPLFTFVNGHAQDFELDSTPVYEQNDLFTEEEKNRLKSFTNEEFVLL